MIGAQARSRPHTAGDVLVCRRTQRGGAPSEFPAAPHSRSHPKCPTGSAAVLRSRLCLSLAVRDCLRHRPPLLAPQVTAAVSGGFAVLLAKRFRRSWERLKQAGTAVRSRARTHTHTHTHTSWVFYSTATQRPPLCALASRHKHPDQLKGCIINLGCPFWLAHAAGTNLACVCYLSCWVLTGLSLARVIVEMTTHSLVAWEVLATVQATGRAHTHTHTHKHTNTHMAQPTNRADHELARRVCPHAFVCACVCTCAVIVFVQACVVALLLQSRMTWDTGVGV